MSDHIAPRQAGTGHELPVISHDLNGCFRPGSLTVYITGNLKQSDE
jgi:hypothetical protein